MSSSIIFLVSSTEKKKKEISEKKGGKGEKERKPSKALTSMIFSSISENFCKRSALLNKTYSAKRG